MRLGRATHLLTGLSHEAVDPPFGPIMMPRYSADGTTEKLDHSGTICLIVLETRLMHSGVGSIPRGMREHFFILRSRPEMSLKRSKLAFKVVRS